MTPHTDSRVLIIADAMLPRMGLAALLDGQETVQVVGQISTQDLNDIAIYRPQVLVWLLSADDMLPTTDFSLPTVFLLADAWENLATMRTLLTDAPPIAILSQQRLAPERLVSAIGAVCDGLMVIDPALFPLLIAPTTMGSHEALSSETLTAREQQVLQLMAEGLPNKQIARTLAISPNTVKFHVNAILGKLEAQSRTEAVIRATQLGWLLL